jgi:putative endonuclease
MVDQRFYVGQTDNLENRLEEHNHGKVSSTKYRRPFIIVYYEACMNKQDALHREKYLKTTYGKRYIRHRLKSFLDHQGK